MELTKPQLSLIESPISSKIFLSGPAGSGKTTTGVERVQFLSENHVPANQILILLPQRSLAAPYQESLALPSFPPGGIPVIATIGGLAHRLIELFWPLIAEEAGFEKPTNPPTFLTLESAQYFMASLVRPLIEEKGYFSSVSIQRNRLYSQILDNLNKAAIHGFSYQEISQRLISAWIGDPGQHSIFDNAQECATLFRMFCLRHNLLDFSLQIELFRDTLWPREKIKDYLHSRYQHLIFDNLEEDIPVCHQFVAELLPSLDSALLIYDENGGYRRFLGADPVSGKQLQTLCKDSVQFKSSFVTPSELTKFEILLSRTITSSAPQVRPAEPPPAYEFIRFSYQQYYPEMISWVGEEISRLLQHDAAPDEIVIIAPFLSDSLRFLLTEELTQRGIQPFSHRPSRALREEPASRCLLTLAATAYPHWKIVPTTYQLLYALLLAIEDLDLTRAALLAEHGSGRSDGVCHWRDFEQFPQTIRGRITYAVGNRYQNLITWIQSAAQDAPQPLDDFFQRLFGEILSQPGFGFHGNFDRAQVASNLIESSKSFRRSVMGPLKLDVMEAGRQYYQMVEEGIISAQYLSAWQRHPPDAVFLAPSTTFLVNNFPVKYQFWLDVGSTGWYERIYQPLTHPYVLNQAWEVGQTWTDADELSYSKHALSRLVKGLIRRCSKTIYFCLTEVDEQGYDQKGLLAQALYQIQPYLSGGNQY